MDFDDIIYKIKEFGNAHPTYWCCAIAGEAGEIANVLKKYERDGIPFKLHDKFIKSKEELNGELSEELADVFLYTALTARQFDIDLETAIIKKIEKVNKRREEFKCDVCLKKTSKVDWLIFKECNDGSIFICPICGATNKIYKI